MRTSRDFRLLFVAGTLTYLGGMITYVAVPFQLYRLTDSNAAVGLVGAVQLVPLLVGGLYGGALADHVDRRRLLVSTGVAQALVTALLALNAARDRPSVAALYVLAFLLAACSSLQRPSREALLPRTVRHDELVAANALGSLGAQVGMLAGPAVGGLLLGGLSGLLAALDSVLRNALGLVLGHVAGGAGSTDGGAAPGVGS